MGAKGIHHCSTADDEGGCGENVSPFLFSFLVPLSGLAARALREMGWVGDYREQVRACADVH